MTTSPSIRKISIFLFGKGLLVVASKVYGIVKVFDVLLSIPFRSIPGLANEIFNLATLTYFHRLHVKQTVYLKRFGNVGITIYKDGRGYVRTKAIEEIIDLRQH